MSTPNDPYGYDPYGQPPSYPAQQYPPYQPYPAYPPPQDLQDPDNALGIVGLVLSVAACAPVGLIVSWIALRKSRERGYRNTMALVGAIVGGVFTAFALLALVIYVGFIVFVFAAVPPTPSLLF